MRAGLLPLLPQHCPPPVLAGAALPQLATLLMPTGEKTDTRELMDFGARSGVMVVPGHVLSVPHLQAAAALRRGEDCAEDCDALVSKANAPCPYFRVSFSSVGSNEEIVEGFVRLRKAILALKSARELGAVEVAS